MTLNSSGPISLGGATTGQSINLELGQSATTQVSLNDSNVRTLAGITTPLSTIVVPLNFWGKSSNVFFMAEITGTNFALYSTQTFDSAGNIYMALQASISAVNRVVVMKISGDGSSVLASTAILQGVIGAQYSGSMLIDSSGNIVVGASAAASGTTYRGFLIKLNSALTSIVSQTDGYYRSGSTVAHANGILSDSSGNFYMFVRDRVLMLKFNSSNTFQWRSGYYDGANTVIANDSDGTTYVGDFGRFQSINSAGTVTINQKYATNLISMAAFITITRQNSTIPYFVLAGNIGVNCCIQAVNKTNGATIWGKTITTASGTIPTGVAFDEDNYLYVLISYSTGVLSHILKFDTSGNLIWQRSLTNTYFIGGGLTVKNGAIILSGANTGAANTRRFLFKLPTSGNGTGTYNVNGLSITYAASSLSIADASFTSGTTTTVSYTQATAAISSSLSSQSFAIARTII
jgi:hypothetical protein